MDRFSGLIRLLAVLAALLAGCGGEDGAPAPAGSAPPAPAPRPADPPRDPNAGLQRLLDTLTSQDETVRSKTMLKLTAFRTEEGVQALLEGLRDTDKVSVNACRSLCQMGPVAVPLLIKSLADQEESASVRFRCAIALGKIGDPSAIPHLIRALKDEDPRVRNCSAIGLGRMKAKEAVEALIVQLDDDLPDPRQWAAEALGKIGDPRAVKHLLRRLKDDYKVVRAKAAWSLKKLMGQDFSAMVEGPDAGQPLPEGLKRLRKEVEEVVAGGTMAIREKADLVFRLARSLANLGRKNEAQLLFERALRAVNHRYAEHLAAARLCLDLGRKELAAERAGVVFHYAEAKELRAEANELLTGLGASYRVPLDLKPANQHDTVTVALVPLGEADRTLLADLACLLSVKTGLAVTVHGKTLPTGRTDYDMAALYVAQLALTARTNLSPAQLSGILKRLGLTEEDLETERGMRKLVEVYLGTYGRQGAVEAFYRRYRQLKRQGQLDADRLLKALEDACAPDLRGTVRGFLGVTGRDIGTLKDNFLFARSRKGYAVVSYYRFVPARYGEPDNPVLLRNRLMKQAITSTMFVLGLKRCATPRCTMSYANTLLEHDRKAPSLCPWCLGRLKQAGAKFH